MADSSAAPSTEKSSPGVRHPFRIGLIVPSSNITMETEIPAMLRARQTIAPDLFTFHSSRMRMRKVTKEELAAMDRQADRCAEELSDAEVDVIGYACLVAIMSMGPGYHREAEDRLGSVARRNHASTQLVSSAGALIEGLRALRAQRVAMITPYMKPLTRLVTDYIEGEGIRVNDAMSLEIADNIAVGERDPRALIDIFPILESRDADVIVLSACVQMPSLEAISVIEASCGKPVVSAAVCTVYSMLKRLGLPTRVPNAGALLSGDF
jgi:maleate isomerase